jgi:hypothetical protein
MYQVFFILLGLLLSLVILIVNAITQVSRFPEKATSSLSVLSLKKSCLVFFSIFVIKKQLTTSKDILLFYFSLSIVMFLSTVIAKNIYFFKKDHFL